jgi:hypothetical protein
MNNYFSSKLKFVIVPFAALLVWGCDVQVKEEGELPNVDVDVNADSGQLPEYEVKQTQEGELPSVDVDVDADAGKLPEIEVQGPDVEIGTKTVDVQVPDVDVQMEETQIEVPTVDVEMPGENDNPRE